MSSNGTASPRGAEKPEGDGWVEKEVDPVTASTVAKAQVGLIRLLAKAIVKKLKREKRDVSEQGH